jgi:TRAP transporter TAXI family solute receptor
MRATIFVLFLLFGGVEAAHAAEAETTIMTGKPTGTYIRIGHDIARVAKEFGIDLAVQPSAGSLENLEAVLRRPRTPLGIVQSDVLDFVASFSDDPELRQTKNMMRMVFPLYNEEVHVLAGSGIKTLADLGGRPVAIGAPDSGTLLTATLVLASAGVRVQEVRIDTDEALTALRQGQVDAMFYVAGRPAKLFADGVAEADGFHLVPITEPAVLDLYPSSSIPGGTYRWQTEEVPTVAVRAVLMTYDYSKPSRYHREACATVGKLARIIADNVAWLRQVGRGHPKWQEVDLNAQLVNWERSRCAEDGLKGPDGYPMVSRQTSCEAQQNPIRRKLCVVQQQMLKQPAAAVAQM